MESLTVVFLLLVSCNTISLVRSAGDENGFISFSISTLTTAEDSNGLYTSVNIPFTRDGGTSGLVAATFKVINSTATDEFLSVSNTALFSDGVSSTIGTLVLINDALPEGNETFVVEIVDARFGAELGSLTTLLLTVEASDEPNGRISFDEGSLSQTDFEPLSGQSNSVQFQVNRGPGIFGKVTVNYKVTVGPDLGMLDISPTEGQIEFEDQMNTSFITIDILSDNTPENSEQFTISLSNPGGGAILADSDTQAQLIISSNDVPVRFGSSITYVSEDVGDLVMTVFRGTVLGGESYGPLEQETTVTYSTTSDTAIDGDDYMSSSGTITFASGETTQTISIPIVNDDIPEGDESFTITLSNPSSDSVLVNPSTIMVVININDNAGGVVRFQSTDTQTISEDEQTTATFVIERTGSTLGNLVIGWSILDENSQLADSDFNPPSGNVTMSAGNSEVDLPIKAWDDSVPEVAEAFTVNIDEIVGGGAKLDNESLRVAMLYVADSDDVYGIVEVNTASGMIIVDGSNRILSFNIIRTAGLTGEIIVEFSILYLPAGVTDITMGTSGEVTPGTGSVKMAEGVSSQDVNVTIFSNGFLDEGSRLYIEITTAQLTNDPLLVEATSSPTVGSVKSLTAIVPFSAASGFISFSSNSVTRTVQEPESGFETVTLSIFRGGIFGTATVTWTALPSGDSSFTPDDLLSSAAVVTIDDGSSSATFDIIINSDNVPELDEPFIVQLLTVTEFNQDLSDTQAMAIVTITMNDNPEGTFVIADVSKGPTFIAEDDPLTIAIQRNGGDLTEEQIQYTVTPNGDTEFFGSVGILTFSIGESLSTAAVLTPIKDNVPEINETFTFQLSATNNDLIGEDSNVSITILANDDWNGAFSFDNSSLSITIDEPANPGTIDNNLVTSANFTIIRKAGLFGNSTVYWAIDTNTSDVTPRNGSVYFTEGQDMGWFVISAVNDQITENDIIHSIQLTSVTGGGRIADADNIATITVSSNDDPIGFLVTDTFRLGNEGDVVTLQVIRGGDVGGMATATFNVTYQTASSDDVIIIPTNGIVVFEDGMTSVDINITLLDDVKPELNENLLLTLISTTGDAAITLSNFESRLTILTSDDGSGIFEFATNSTNNVISEGSTITLIVERGAGSFGLVIVTWKLYRVDPITSNLSLAVTDDDFEIVAGLIVFNEEETSKSIVLSVIDDNLAELEENYHVVLDDVTVGRLGDNVTSLLTILESDDPNGAFEFIGDSAFDTWIAEDVPIDDNTDNNTGVFSVSRGGGTFGTATVVWEVHPVSSPYLPPFTDLIVEGTIDPSVQPIDLSRPYSETVAYNFTGEAKSIVTVSSFDQLSDSKYFSLSAWLYLYSNTNGIVMAKGSEDGSTIHYGFGIVANDSNSIIRLYYLPETEQVGYSTVDVSLPNTVLTIMDFHSVILVVEEDKVEFYVDGVFQTERTLTASINDGNGVVTVGGLMQSMFFEGFLQDVRIYSSSLTQDQVTEIALEPASYDISPVTGLMTFTEGQQQNMFTITSMNDDDIEFTEQFDVQLVYSNGGSRIATNGTLLSVLKSDYSNGLFSLASDDIAPVDEDSVTIPVLVVRERGLYSEVMVFWKVTLNGTNVLAADDFEYSTGFILFEANEAQKPIMLQVKDETVPELSESYLVTLTSAVSTDIYPSTQSFSGAAIDTALSQTTVYIAENDFLYGALQFADTAPIDDGIISLATEILTIDVIESSGEATVFIVRAQGTLGEGTVQYSTSDGTAISGGVSPDYITTGGTFVFEDGERVKNFTVMLVDNSVPELSKHFFINLTIPDEDSNIGLDIGRDVIINILPSDDAFGIFSFTENTRSEIVDELQDKNSAVFTIFRGSKGAFGNVSVYWEVDNPTSDISPTSGYINFTVGELSMDLTIYVTNDINPEFHEVFNIVLISTIGGGTIDTVGGANIAILTISASDYPYGLFSFTSVFRPFIVTETSDPKTVTIVREFGKTGQVKVDYMTMMATELGVNYIATENSDYIGITGGSVTFAHNITSRSVQFTIVEDNIPELDEQFYIILTNVTLIDDPVPNLGLDGLPAISSADNATIIIQQNDNARGVIEFGSASFSVSEGDSNFITLNRTPGALGDVQVSWMITFDTAIPADVSAVSGTDTLFEGVVTGFIGLTIINDSFPETVESFTVQLTAISDGGELGSLILTTVTIGASDDPFGLFGFNDASQLLVAQEPETGLTEVTLSILRNGGTVGVAEVYWNISTNNDIQTLEGTVVFSSGDSVKSFVISVLPDDIPELQESFTVTIQSLTGGGRINFNTNKAVILISANDKPFGSISLQPLTVTGTEQDDSESTLPITIQRTGNNLGAVQIFYTVRRSYPYSLDAFSAPIKETSPMLTYKSFEITVFETADIINECAVRCVLAHSLCKSFVVDTSNSICEIYSDTIGGSGNITRTSVQYYEAIYGQLETIARHLATPDEDFQSVTNGGNVTLANEMNSAVAMVTILPDTIPELFENLTIVLTSVTVTDSDIILPENLPTFDDTPLTISILENDDPNGRFTINSGQLQLVSVEEGTSASFTIERGGSFGQATVNWNRTLSSDIDDLSGDTVVFLPGETKYTFSISVIDDEIPEGAEYLEVFLSDPTGGAVLGAPNYTVVTMVIQANDGAAGSVGFAVNSRAVNIVEGENVTLTVERTVGQSGIIRVYWRINGTNAVNEFESVSGSFLVADGVNVTSFDIMVKIDNSSELNEIFIIELTKVEAVSNDVGEPSINTGASISSLTVEANENPYGQVGFSQNSFTVTTEEEDPATATITRNFGSFNTIQVNYRAVSSVNINVMQNMIAVAGVDFNDTIMSVQLADGVTGVEIPIPIFDDDMPEFMEFFSIEILSAFLVSDPSLTVPVSADNTSLIIISNSDNPNGRIEFENETFTINEDVGIYTIFIQRNQGLIGVVSINYQINHIDTSDDDFDSFIQSGSILFDDDVDVQVLQLSIANDIVPELAEMFCIELFGPNGGVDLGDINSTCITITASDDPNGVFSFTDGSLQATIQEATGDIVNDNNLVVLTVMRSGGLIGDVTVPFSVDSNDLSPNSGVFLFVEDDTEKSITLTAIADSNPELNEIHSITLGAPTSGRLNDTNTVSNVTILANQVPFGVLTLYTSDGLSSVSVEENIGTISFEIRRTFPSFDEIMVTFSSIEQEGSGEPLLAASDYQELVTTISMLPNQTAAIVNLEIFDDVIPEIDETFNVTISNPVGGATLGGQIKVPVTILSNDDAHGRIGFDEESLSVIVTEQDGSDTVVSLTVERLGTIGDVTLQWEVTGEHSIGEVTPTEGMVTFTDGVGVATINLVIVHDINPELNEVTMVTLTEILDNGVPEGGDETRGATLISGRSTSVITVSANDDPHGLFLWSSETLDVEELEDTGNVVTVYILREFGTIGDVIVNYRSYSGLSTPIDTRATINDDYRNETDAVVFSEGQTSYPINITIHKDDIPELTELFNISIDGVKLVNESVREGSFTDSPRIGQGIVTIGILANDIPNGILDFTGPKVVTVEENADVVCLPVTRSHGTFGVVGSGFIISNITANGGGIDYTPDTGMVEIEVYSDQGCADVTIINDLDPEIDESFSVTLVNAFGGAILGTNLTITVIIKKNDDVNGLFTLSSDSLVLFVPEGDEITLTVERSKGSVGVVTVDWVIEESGWNDLVPNAGNVTFQEGETSKSFAVMATEDGIPEVYESYTLFLLAASGDGRITSPKTASIAIPASDEPNGVIGFSSYPLNTIIVQEGDSFIVSAVRTGGLFGSVTMQWALTPTDATVFTTTSATEEFADGQSSLNFTVLTIQDSKAEVARQFDLTIIGSGDATINSSAANLKVIVAASDNIHGVVSFSSVSSSFSEDGGVTSVTVLRSGGLVGDIRVNYTAEDREAFSPNDYSLSTNSIIISDNSNTGTISVTIVDDETPEINEFFVININSVELINDINGGRDFDYDGDVSLIDSQPILGAIVTTNINIQENDDARGIFSFATSTVSTTEGSTLIIDIERSKGTFGAPSVHYIISDEGTANDDDYSTATPTSPIIFAVGQSSRSISISIVDDDEAELEEFFTVELAGINNGGSLGDISTITVFIDVSDNPLGTVAFSDSTLIGQVISNPTLSSAFVSLFVEQEGGELQAQAIDVFYTITGPVPGKESDDVDTSQNSIQIFMGQPVANILVTVFANSDGFEPEETFTVTLTSATDGVTLVEGATQATITVLELGQPYGVVTFFGEALGIQVTDESSDVTFPIIRNEGAFVSTEVFYAVSGSDPSADITPTAGSIILQEGQSVSSITLTILADQTPELDEQFILTLTNATGGTVIDPIVFTSTFVIEANESPYGTFGLTNASLVLYPVGGAMLRRLSFTIQRDFGTDETVQVVTSIRYELEPDEGYFPSNVTKTFVPGQSESIVIVDSTADAFLTPNSNIILTITSVELITNSDESDVLPEISPFIGSIQHMIDGSVANAIVGFSLSSVMATVIDGSMSDNVILTVERNGAVGGVQISWSVGIYLEGVVNGSLTPIVGSVMIGPDEDNVILSFTATPTDPPSLPEVFAVNLFVQTLSSLSARIADERGVAIIEPEGVIKLRYQSFSEIEGATVFMSVSRIYGSTGPITVTGNTMMAATSDLGTNELAADPITDYPLGGMTITLQDGQTSGDILLILPYNSGTSPLKVFTFVLTSAATPGQVDDDSSPRLATPIYIVPVTIIDAEGGSGVFEFVNSSTIISEDGSPLAQGLIRRNEGVLGTVAVRVSILLARADNTTPDNQVASTDDFSSDSLFTLVTFASGEDLKPVSIQILDDNIAEITEYFTLQIENPQGGKAIINNAKSTFEVAIIANDNQGGLFNLVTHSLVLSEDDSLQGTFVVTRELGLFETVDVDWRASYTDGNIHSVALGDLLVEDSGTVTFIPGQTSAEFTITLQQDKVPLSSETFTITISSEAEGVVFGEKTASVTALPSGFSIFQFTESSRKLITSPFTVTLNIERTKGQTLDTSVQYYTEEPTEPVTVGQLTFEPAQAGSHFTLVAQDTVFFEPNKGNESIHISIISTDLIPRAFFVSLQAVGSDSVINSQAIVVIAPPGTLTDLYTVYFNAIDASTSSTLNSVATDVMEIIVEQSVLGTDSTLSTIVLLTLEEIYNTIVQQQIIYTDSLQTTMSNIYQLITADSTYSGRADVAEYMTSFGDSLLTGLDCNSDSVIISQSSYIIRAVRVTPTNIHTLDLRTTDNDFISLPDTNLEVTTDCVNVIFVAYSTSNLFSGPLLGDKVVTISLKQPEVTKLNMPLTYRISSLNGNIFPSSNSCLIWRPSVTGDQVGGYWDSSVCKLSKSSVIEMDHIECECQSLGQFAVSPPPNYGWTIPGPVSCAFVVLVMMAIILLHLYYFRRIQLGTRILIMLCSAIAIFELIALVDMVVSTDISNSGCVAIGIILHLSVVSVFVWMMMLIVSLWLNLMSFTSGQEPLVVYIFISWGLSAAIVIATILVGIYALSLSLDEVYGRVGEMCFIPSVGVAGVSTALPIVVTLLVAIGMLSHSCIYWTRWEDIKSLYKDTYNKRDIPLLLILYSLIIFALLFGGLHLYLQQIYLFFVFFGFNVIFGIYSLIVYVFMSWHTLTWKHKHYPIKEEVQPLSLPEEPEFIPPTFPDVYGSRQSLIPRYQDQDPVPPQHDTIKSTVSSSSSRPTLPHPPRKPSANRVMAEIRETSEPDTRTQSHVTQSHVTQSVISEQEDGDSDSELGNYEIAQHESDESESQMDDLLYALKTDGSGFSASQGGDDDDEFRPLIREMDVVTRQKKPPSDQYRMRRISIADTHL